jgi:hypothetical protein
MPITIARRFKKAKHVRSSLIDDGSRRGDSEEEKMDGSESDGFIADEDSIDYHTDHEPTEKDHFSLEVGKELADDYMDELRRKHAQQSMKKKLETDEMHREILQEEIEVRKKAKQRKRKKIASEDEDDGKDADEILEELKSRKSMNAADSKEYKMLLAQSMRTVVTNVKTGGTATTTDFATDDQAERDQVSVSSLAESPLLQNDLVSAGARLKQSLLTPMGPTPAAKPSGSVTSVKGKTAPSTAARSSNDATNALNLPPGALSNWGIGQHFEYKYPGEKLPKRFITTYYSDKPVPTGTTNDDVQWNKLDLEHVSTAKVIDSDPPVYESFVFCETSKVPKLIAKTNGLRMLSKESVEAKKKIKQFALECNNFDTEHQRVIIPTTLYASLTEVKSSANGGDASASSSADPAKQATVVNQLMDYIFSITLKGLQPDALEQQFYTNCRDRWNQWADEAKAKANAGGKHWCSELWNRVLTEYAQDIKEKPHTFRTMLVQLYPMLFPQAAQRLEAAIQTKRKSANKEN